jgi:thiosulfate dehydrogenase
MRYRIVPSLVCCLVGLGVALGAFGHGSEPHHRSVDPASSPLKLGGLLYDNWPKMKGAAVAGNHPLYPPDGKKRGGSTWRCKECHGWDYLGARGRYAQGSHYTGIGGVLGARDATQRDLSTVLSGGVAGHDFSAQLTVAERSALAVFLTEGLLDWESEVRLEDPEGEAAARGTPLFADHCASCHGADGRKIDLSDADGQQGVGWLARKNPQETLHKIRWGHPGTEMPSAVVDGGLGNRQTVDVLLFARQLP